MEAIRSCGRWLPQKKTRILSPHTDPGLELVYLARGEIVWDYGGRSIDVRPPAVSFALPWQEHSSATLRVPSCELHWVLIGLDDHYESEPITFGLHPDLNIQRDDEARILNLIRRAPYPVVAADNLLADLIPRMVTEFHGDCDATRLRSLANLTLVELALALQRRHDPEPPPTSRQRVRAFLDELQASCDQPWTLEEMAGRCALGRTQFAEHLKALTGDSPVQLLNRLRVDKAVRLLRDTDQEVTDIAFACGFNSSQYFARVFSDYSGLSATDWRESHQSKRPVGL